MAKAVAARLDVQAGLGYACAPMTIGPSLTQPAEENKFQNDFIVRLAASFARVTGRSLADAAGLSPAALASDGWGRSIWSGRFALLTHRGDCDATLNYANAFALHLWAIDWAQMTLMPSRDTAPVEERALRAQFMDQVAAHNFAGNYCGRRISRNGRLFEIRNATVWRLLDETGADFGVGAFFQDFEYL
jgi:hypothetical protein